jgi:hypothetical protein
MVTGQVEGSKSIVSALKMYSGISYRNLSCWYGKIEGCHKKVFKEKRIRNTFTFNV